MDDLYSLDSLAAEPIGRVVELVDALLWGFGDPRFWLSESDVHKLAAALRRRADSHTEKVQEALANCAEYLRIACDGAHLRLADRG
ncbi:hypothetical protein C6P72_29705 [Burkholderia gladioli]|nr:hypothetical protein C6P72_29705 [Burkholderia gladioli]HDR9202747.1 hypothetical protein [Burkholderia vietnamiensis]